MHNLLLIAALVLCLTSIGFYLFCIYSALDFFPRSRKQARERTDYLPPVSILKSVCGVGDGTYHNLASFCEQHYPRYQIIFGVQDRRDPVVSVIQRLMRDFRLQDIDIQLVVCDRAMGTNPKVSNLIQMEARAQYPFLLISDSDIRVGRDYLRQVIQPMRNPNVGAVTCMCHSLSKGIVGTLEALKESTEFCPQVLAARKLEGIKFGLGSTILVRRQALEQIGGLTPIADYLADDFLLGNRIANAGYTVVISDFIVEHELSIQDFRRFVQRQIRWNRGIRSCRPWGYRGLLFSYGVPAGFIFWVLSGRSFWGTAVFSATVLARWVMGYVVGALFLNDRAARRFLWAVPLQDLISFALWCFGLVGNAVYWGGNYFLLTPEGKLVLVPAKAAPSHPTDRVGSREDAVPVAH